MNSLVDLLKFPRGTNGKPLHESHEVIKVTTVSRGWCNLRALALAHSLRLYYKSQSTRQTVLRIQRLQYTIMAISYACVYIYLARERNEKLEGEEEKNRQGVCVRYIYLLYVLWHRIYAQEWNPSLFCTRASSRTTSIRERERNVQTKVWGPLYSKILLTPAAHRPWRLQVGKWKFYGIQYNSLGKSLLYRPLKKFRNFL